MTSPFGYLVGVTVGIRGANVMASLWTEFLGAAGEWGVNSCDSGFLFLLFAGGFIRLSTCVYCGNLQKCC